MVTLGFIMSDEFNRSFSEVLAIQKMNVKLRYQLTKLLNKLQAEQRICHALLENHRESMGQVNEARSKSNAGDAFIPYSDDVIKVLEIKANIEPCLSLEHTDGLELTPSQYACLHAFILEN